MTNKPTWEEEFDGIWGHVCMDCDGVGVSLERELQKSKHFISTKLAEQKKELIEIIKTPMSTEFEDPEEESADYSIEDFRARLLNLIKQD